MIRRTMIVATILLLCSVSPTFAQSFEEAEQEAMSARPLGGSGPDVFISEYWGLPMRWTVSTIHGDWQGRGDARGRRWVIRRVIGGPDEPARLTWADSRSCPAVEDVLVAMETMERARPEAIGVGLQDERIGVVFDGARVTFRSRWARAESNGAVIELQLRGNVNAPHAIWWAESVEALDECWSTSAPE